MNVRELIADRLGIADELEPDVTLASLNMDSLDFIDLIAAVESEFDIDAPPAMLAQLRTVGDIEDLVGSYQ